MTDLMIHLTNAISPLSWHGVWTALLCGSIVGIERQLSGKPAGIRTSCLICIGTYAFVAAGAGFEGDRADPTRVVGQVITGVGFLGAGVMLARDGMILGVTSAAVIWVLAAIGVQIGLGHESAAIILSILIVGILVGVNRLENTFISLQRGVHMHLTTIKRRKRRQQRTTKPKEAPEEGAEQ